jgi:uncharacterized protein YlxW (UPF0749 family)
MTSLPNSGNYAMPRHSADSLADILERVLDKGIVIAGDVVVNVLDIELLTLKLRLLVASVDTAKQMGIDWWQDDPFLSRDARSLERENSQLRQRVNELESRQTAQADG